MKCEFCGKDIENGVIKCKYCRMFLDGSKNDQPLIDCPECGGKIVEGAKICRFCRSEIVRENKGVKKNSKEEATEGNYPTEKKDRKKSTWENIEGNIVWIFGGLLLVYWIISSIINGKNYNNSNSIDSNLEESTLMDEQFFIKDSNNDEESPKKQKLGEITFQPTTNGYKTKGEVEGYTITCNIPGNTKKINEFVKGLNDNKEVIAEGCTFVKPENDDYDDYDEDLFDDFSFGGKQIGIFFDNSFADNGRKTDGPDKRMLDLSKILTNKNFPDGSHIKIVIPYGLGEDVKFLNSDAFYEFDIDKSLFEPTNSVLNGSVKYHLLDEDVELKYLPGTKTLFTNGAEFDFVLDNPDIFYSYDTDKTQCKMGSEVSYDSDEEKFSETEDTILYSNGGNIENQYVCRDARQVYKKFHAIYMNYYRENPKAHSGNLLVNAITDSPDIFDWDDLYIFSDGEFELGEGWGMKEQIKKFKKETTVDAKQQEEFPLILFHENVYKHYNQDGVFNKFWLNSLKWIKSQNDNECTKTKVHLIGFKQYLLNFEIIALKELFGSCEIVTNN